MSRRYEREGSPQLPIHYTAPLFRPPELTDPFASVNWDMRDNWLTAAEWLAWCKRGKKMWKRWNGRRLVYPSRPQIAATVIQGYRRKSAVIYRRAAV